MSRLLDINAGRSRFLPLRLRRWHSPLLLLAAGLVTVVTGANSQDKTPTAKPSVNSAPAPSTKPKTQHHWYQVGVASWYGSELLGKQTANGETFDPAQFTCAHRDLPLGSWLRVTNLRNRKSVIVRVNDRGPLFDDRIVDLSQQAASAIDMRGMAHVRLELITPNEIARSLITNISSLQMPALLPPPR